MRTLRFLSSLFLLFAVNQAWGQRSHIDLGVSVGIALDQPRVAVEVIAPPSTSLGPSFFNTLLLDTGAERILITGNAVGELESAGYVTEGTFLEQGVSGFTEFDVSSPYQIDFAGSDGTRQTVSSARILSNSELQLGGFNGLVGMPGMVGRVVTLDFSVWSGGNLFTLMGVTFPTNLPASSGHRYSFPLRPVEFPVPDTSPEPAAAPLPFLTAIVGHGGLRGIGEFVLDTGAQLSIISARLAFQIGLDADNDGDLLDDADYTVEIGGIGGTVEAPVFTIDSLAVPTDQDIDLAWGPLAVLALDIHPLIDGVFGSDLLTAGWLSIVDGAAQQVHFDFRDYPAQLGTAYIDLTASNDLVTAGTGPLDADGDYIDDGWETLYFPTATTNGFDTDADGWSDLAEIALRSDPARTSVVPVFSIEPGPEVVFDRNTDTTNLTVRLQHRTDASENWMDVQPSPTSTRTGIFNERLTFPVTSQSHQHFRLSIDADPVSP